MRHVGKILLVVTVLYILYAMFSLDAYILALAPLPAEDLNTNK